MSCCCCAAAVTAAAAAAAAATGAAAATAATGAAAATAAHCVLSAFHGSALCTKRLVCTKAGRGTIRRDVSLRLCFTDFKYVLMTGLPRTPQF